MNNFIEESDRIDALCNMTPIQRKAVSAQTMAGIIIGITLTIPDLAPTPDAMRNLMNSVLDASSGLELDNEIANSIIESIQYIERE